jgi:hypothetical protein
MNHKQYMHAHNIGFKHDVRIERLTDKQSAVMICTTVQSGSGSRGNFRQCEKILCFNCGTSEIADSVNSRSDENLCEALTAAIPNWREHGATPQAAPEDVDLNLNADEPIEEKPVEEKPVEEKPAPEKKKRKRRTKAEIEADRARGVSAGGKKENKSVPDIPTEEFDRTNKIHKRVVANIGVLIWSDFTKNQEALNTVRQIVTKFVEKGVKIPATGQPAKSFIAAFCKELENSNPEIRGDEVVKALADYKVGD